MSAPLPGHPPDPRKGHMAAQPDRSPVNMSSDYDAPAVTPTLILPPPMTPVLTTGLDFKTLYDNCDPFHRRPQPDIPFFTEPDADAQAKLTTYQNKRRQIETDVASVIFEDPWRNGATTCLCMQSDECIASD